MVLVTGATGVAGGAVIREFVRRGAPVRALVRDRSRAQALSAYPNVQLVEGDLLRPDSLGPALHGVDRALLLSSADPRMVEAQCAFIDAAHRAGVRHLVKFSGRNSVLGSPFRYWRMHAEVERHLETSGLAWTHLRPGQFMAVFFRDIPTLVSKNALFAPLGDATLTPVDLDDVARVAFALLHSEGHEGRRYDLTGPEALTMTEIAARLSVVLGRPLRYVDLPPAEATRAWLSAGLDPDFVAALDELFAQRRQGSDAVVHLATHHAFGLRPTPFAEFAQRRAATFRGEDRILPAAPIVLQP